MMTHKCRLCFVVIHEEVMSRLLLEELTTVFNQYVFSPLVLRTMVGRPSRFLVVCCGAFSTHDRYHFVYFPLRVSLSNCLSDWNCF